MTASYQEIKTLEALTGAREALLDPECGPQNVESALQTAVDALEKTGIDPKPVVEHLNKHVQLTGEDGFPSTSRRQCHSTLSRVQDELRQEFGASLGPDCRRCGTALPRGTSETYCAECRTDSLDPKEEVASTGGLVNQMLESVEDVTNLNLNSDNSTNVYVGNNQTNRDSNNTNLNINSNNSTNVDIEGEMDGDLTILNDVGSDTEISNGDGSSE